MKYQFLGRNVLKLIFHLIKFGAFILMTVLFVIQNLGWGAQTLTLENSSQLFALLSILLLVFYNENLRGNPKFKYLFYVFYPLHLVILLLLTLFRKITV